MDGQGATVFFKIWSETPLIFPLNFVTRGQQEQIQQKQHFLYGVFYGAIFILALYNAGVYFSLRDKSYRFYILYILAFSLVQASTTGLGQQYLWSAYDNVTTRIALFAIILTNYFTIMFAIYFLDLSSNRPNFVKPMLWIARAVLLFIPGLFLEHYVYTQFAIHVMNFVGMGAILIATFSVLESNRRPVIYMLASYSILFSAIILATLFQANLVNHYSYIDNSTDGFLHGDYYHY